ncbi:hypothetical protein BFP75_12675 [Maribacter sp. 4G9]|nr:hypothetical protein BFP75_12675 [Maribacter sp. 4G9]
MLDYKKFKIISPNNPVVGELLKFNLEGKKMEDFIQSIIFTATLGLQYEQVKAAHEQCSRGLEHIVE